MTYNPQAVDNAIAQANRRTPVSSRERKMIHAILKGREHDNSRQSWPRRDERQG